MSKTYVKLAAAPGKGRIYRTELYNEYGEILSIEDCELADLDKRVNGGANKLRMTNPWGILLSSGNILPTSQPQWKQRS